jgi:hypothetical protein
MDNKDKALRDVHLRHFNRVAQDHPDKPVWWCVAQAIKRFEIFNGERSLGHRPNGVDCPSDC